MVPRVFHITSTNNQEVNHIGQTRAQSPVYCLHLDLGHAGCRAATTTTGPAAQVDSSGAGHEDRDNDGSHVACPREPEESNGGLGFTAALGHVE